MNYISNGLLAGGNNGTSFAIPMPTGYAVGDALVMALGWDIGFGASGNPILPTGWTQIGATKSFLSGRKMLWCYRIADGSEGSSFAMTGWGAGNFSSADTAAYRAPGTYDIGDAVIIPGPSSSGSSPSLLTTAAADNVILSVAIIDVAQGVVTAPLPSGFTEDVHALSDTGVMFIYDWLHGLAGGAGSQSWAISLSATNSDAWAIMALALVAPSAPVVPPDPTLGIIRPIAKGAFA